MRWRDFSTRFGRYLAIQTLVSSLFLMFLISVGTATNAAWDYNNRGVWHLPFLIECVRLLSLVFRNGLKTSSIGDIKNTRDQTDDIRV